MKAIIKTQIKLMQSKYGYFLYFIPLYQLVKSIYYFLGCIAGCLMVWLLFLQQGYLTRTVYEQIIIVVSFGCILLFKKEKQFAIIPYITKLKTSKIKNYILIRELMSGFNFIMFSLVVPVLIFSNTIKAENSTITYIYIFISLWLMGLWLNLLARIFKFLSTKHKLFFIISSSIILAYSIILILFYRNVNVTSYSSLLNNGHYIILLIIGITLTIPGYFHVVKQELYQVYSEKNLGNGAIRNLKTSLTSSNVFIRILILEYIRCKIFKKFLIQMSSYAIAGAVFILVFNLKVIGLGMFLGIYTYNMLQFTIYFSSNYFDGLQTKPISIKTLLLSSYYIHIIITAVLFLILLIFVSIYDKSYILSLITLYLYTSGPIALLLLTNVLFAEKFDLFPLQLNTPIQRTLAQKVIGVISAVTLIGGASIIHFFTTIGCYIILLISIVTIITHSYWIDYLHKKFIQRKYRIMDNLRKN